MNKPIVIEAFVEDRAHEEFIRAMIHRITEEENKQVDLYFRTARGGHGRVMHEFKVYQKLISKDPKTIFEKPDLFLVAIDGNCKDYLTAKREIEEEIAEEYKDRAIIACPDPHIERWFLADPPSFFRVVGLEPALGRKKCERDHYKNILSSVIIKAGHPATLGGLEFARELVAQMDLYQAGKTEPSLGHFLEETRRRFRSIR
ncbi:MAG: hypothetical protein AB1641_18295 [Thermodesulfobacteriota bacterium]